VRSPAWSVGDPQRRHVSHLSRVRQRYTVLSGIPTHSAAVCAFEQGQRQQQGLHLLRAMRRFAIARDVVAYRAALGECEGASSTRRRHSSYVQ